MSSSLHFAIKAAGMEPPESLKPGINRMPGIGKRLSNRAGWCWMSADGEAAVYGDWSTDYKGTWFADGGDRKPEAIAVVKHQVRIAHEKRQKQRIQEQVIAAAECNQRWINGHPAPADYAYFIDKRIKSERLDLFRLHADNRIMLQLKRIDGALVNLQYISANGEKRFHYRAELSGSFVWFKE